MLLLCVLNSSINALTHFWISSSVTSNRAAVLSAALRRPMICLETSWPSGLSSVSFREAEGEMDLAIVLVVILQESRLTLLW
jgi:hypothetical protein